MNNALNIDTELVTIEVPCPICGADGKEFLGTFHFQQQVLGVAECAECGLVYVSPRLTDQAMEAYFQIYTDVSSARIIARWRVNRQPHVEHDLGWLKLLLPGGGKVLDVGSGYGFFLEQARALGYETVGVELSCPACEHACRQLGLEVRLGRLEELGLAPETFDAVVCSDVLDYLSDPLGELLQMERVLRRGGFLLVRVLNRIHYARLWQAIVRRMDGRASRSFEANPFLEKDRLVFFNRRTLELILTRSRIEPILAFNARLSYWPEQNFSIRLLRRLADQVFDALWSLSGRRWCLAPSVTMVARKS